MRKKFVALFAVASLFAISLLAGCTVGVASGGVSLDDYGKANYSGKTLTVSLNSNPTTGYEWSYVIDGSTVNCTDKKYSSSESTNKNAAGASGTQTFTFEGVSQGESKITLTNTSAAGQSSADVTSTITITTDSSGKITKLSANTVSNGKTDYTSTGL